MGPTGEEIMANLSNPQTFLFLSQILGKKIVDPQGKGWGRIWDLSATIGETYPLITGIFARSGKTQIRLPWQQIQQIGDVLIAAPPAVDGCGAPPPATGEIRLKESLLDKQIVDTHGAKVVRVNDVHLLKVNRTLWLVHVDVGFRGLMRRVGLESAARKFFLWFFDYQLKDQFIPWRFVHPLFSPNLLRLKVAQKRLALLHPADLADIIEDLDIHKRSEFFQSLDVETAAEALEETDPKIQVRLIESMNPAFASDIIEEMSPGEAADLLGDLPKEKAEGILREMHHEMAEEVKELLVHPEEKAGGLMTTSFPALSPEANVAEAIDWLRKQSENLDLIYYLYLIDGEERLLGVLSLRELLTAPAQARLGTLMDTRVVSVNLEDEKEEIANRFAKYGLKAIPVVDDQNRMKGVILFKSLLEIVAPDLGK
jgi:magnesium transporter